LVRGDAKEICDALVDLLDLALGRQCVGESWDVVDDEPEVMLAQAQSLFGTFAFVDVRQEIAPARNVSVTVAQWTDSR
jgi:hypothetical protein